MIIGNGMMAKACKLIDRDDIIIFASGVSNSNETREYQFQREAKLLDRYLNNDKTLVYFSSKESYENPYFAHKQEMCEKVKRNDKYIILHLSQVVGHGGNINNLFNKIWLSLIKGEEIKAYPALRSLIDIDDVVMVLRHLLDNNLPGEHNLYEVDPLPMIDIIRMMEKQMEKKADVTEIEGEVQGVPANSDLINAIIEPLKEGYTERLINKYIWL